MSWLVACDKGWSTRAGKLWLRSGSQNLSGIRTYLENNTLKSKSLIRIWAFFTKCSPNLNWNYMHVTKRMYNGLEVSLPNLPCCENLKRYCCLLFNVNHLVNWYSCWSDVCPVPSHFYIKRFISADIHQVSTPLAQNMQDMEPSDSSQNPLIHANVKPYECEMCKKKFTRKGSLSKHMVTHLGGKLYECEICGKNFTQKYSLTQHMLIHMGVKDHGCEICGKKFTQKSNLLQHLVTHTGERRHECEICKKKFTQKSYLSVHVLTHMEEKTHQCEMCGRSFKQNGHLLMHLRLVHATERPSEPETWTVKEIYMKKASLLLRELYKENGLN